MKFELNKYIRVFAWTPIRYAERLEDSSYKMHTAWFKHVWMHATRGQGGAIVFNYKSDDTYKREWMMTVMRSIKTDFSDEEIQAYFNKVGVSHMTHSTSDAIAEIATYFNEHGAE